MTENENIVPIRQGSEITTLFTKFPEIAEILDKALKHEVDPAYIKPKFGGYLYVDGRYMENLFNFYFPVSESDLVDKIVIKDYWIIYMVKVTAHLAPGIKISRLGSGGSRVNIPADLSKDVSAGRATVTPLDYIDAGNDSKSALTRAYSNAYSRFGIAGSVYNRIILSGKELKKLKTDMLYILKHIPNVRRRTEIKEKFNQCKNPAEQMAVLRDAQDEFDIHGEKEIEVESNEL